MLWYPVIMMYMGNELCASVFLSTTHLNMMQYVFVATTTKFSLCWFLTEPHRPITQGSKQRPFILKKNMKAVRKSQMPLENTAYGNRKTMAVVFA